MTGRAKPTALPLGYRGSIRIQDVVDLVAEIGPGQYDRANLYERYRAFVSARGRVGGNAQAFGMVLAELGHEKVDAWRIAAPDA